MNTIISSVRAVSVVLGIIFVMVLAVSAPFAVMNTAVAHAQSAGGTGGGCCGGGGSGSSGGGGHGTNYCAMGDIGAWPNCVTPHYQCPSGYTGTYPNCVPPSCPTNYTGNYPNCTPPPTCPTGDTGSYPNCVAPSCPTGYTGSYPNCVPPTYVCPTGYTGTYPNCVPPTYLCPTGYTGTYPNCVPPTFTCPTDTTGNYPNCVYSVLSGGIVINNNNNNTNNNSNTNNNNSSASNNNYAPVTQTVNGGQYAASYGQPTVTYQYQAQTQTYIPSYTSGWNGAQNYAYTYPRSTYIAPVTPYVSLTQIPYTGFDFGTYGDSVYFALIAAFGIAAAYLLAYYAGAGSLVRKLALKLDGVRGYNNLV